MTSYILKVIGYPASETNGIYEWGITEARGKQFAAGRGTITGSGNAAPWRSSGLPTMLYSPASRRFWPKTIRER
jgi:hypothetical protein